MWDKILKQMHARALNEWAGGRQWRQQRGDRELGLGRKRGRPEADPLHLAIFQDGAPRSVRILYLNPGTQRYI